MDDIKNTLISWRNRITRVVYIFVLKPFFFLQDPEVVHDRMVKCGVMLGKYSLGKRLLHMLYGYENTMLEQEVLGMSIKNPIGLSAGFDKNAELTDIFSSIGFGFAEVGSITGNFCAGNPKPRLWRLPQSKSLLVYYGLKNDGCEVVAGRLQNKKFSLPVGMSVAMTNCKENLKVEPAIADFHKAFLTMESIGSYVTVNISCPNTMGGQPFIIPEHLEMLLQSLDTIATDKPVFVKFSPDLEYAQIDALLDVIRVHRVQGIICSNLTKKRNNPKIIEQDISVYGGMSGKVVQELADAMLSYIYKKEGKRFVLVGCGGVFTAEDAYKKIRLGATLVQMITGMIFEGPQVVSEINEGLVRLLKRDNFTNISEAIGVDNEGN